MVLFAPTSIVSSFSYRKLEIKLTGGRQANVGTGTFGDEGIRIPSEAELAYLEATARHLGLAISRIMLIEELKDSFEEVRNGRTQLRALSQRLVESLEEERRHLARELHDEVGQSLTGIALALKLSTREKDPDARQAKLDSAQALIDEMSARVEDMSLNLRPSMLDDLGLLPSLLWLFDRYTIQTDVQVQFEHSGLEDCRFTPQLETTVYRITQETLTNIARHAETQHVMVRIWANQELVMQVEDQGRGFDLQEARASSESAGLAGMHERAVLAGGSLEIISAPGAGTKITATFPLEMT